MRIGIVSYWFNRGQATIGRHLRSALDDLGHETHVLARPTAETFVRPEFVDRSGVWDQSGVTAASRWAIPREEYLEWSKRLALDAVIFFQNYQFAEIGELRRHGVKTLGTFMRESFGPSHVEDARRAYDHIYALTHSDQRRFADLGIQTTLIPWGIHPELVRERRVAESGAVRLLFPAGFLSARKPILSVLRAFENLDDDEMRLLVKAQAVPGLGEGLRLRDLREPGKLKRYLAQMPLGRLAVAWIRGQRGSARRSFVLSGHELLARMQHDRRCRLYLGDVSTEEHLELFGRADVCVAPSRWEGLGLHLFEATGAGVPMVVNDLPPMNEIVRHEQNGLLVRGTISGETPSGAPIHEVDEEELGAALARLRDPALRERLRAGALERRAELSWSHTLEGLRRLLANL